MPARIDDPTGRVDVLLLRLAEALTKNFIRSHQKAIRDIEKFMEPVVDAMQAARTVEQQKRKRRGRVS